MTRKNKSKKGKTTSVSPKKAKRTAIIEKIREALAGWKSEWPEKKFESKIRKAAKHFLDGKSVAPKKQKKAQVAPKQVIEPVAQAE